MKKKTKSKILAIRVPLPIFDKFKEKCELENFKMSEVIRLFLLDFSQNGMKQFKKGTS